MRSDQRIWSLTRPYFQIPRGERGQALARVGALSLAQIKAFYGIPETPGQFPAGPVAIVSLGGGYTASDIDLSVGVGGLSKRVTDVSAGGANSPGSDADVENILDLVMAGALSPSAALSFVSAPNTDQGFIDAVHVARTLPNKPSVISISWGGPEDMFGKSIRQALEAETAAAAADGITVTAAAGDNLATDSTRGLKVDCPACLPAVLAVGGTTVVPGAQHPETVWNDGTEGGGTGGGISAFYPVQASNLYFHSTGGKPQPLTQGRGVPDVAFLADPATGVPLVYQGQTEVVGGTSAGAPAWAGIISLLQTFLGRPIPNFKAMLYAHPECLRDVTLGNNGNPSLGEVRGYGASPGYDLCTGWGSPNFPVLLQVAQTWKG